MLLDRICRRHELLAGAIEFTASMVIRLAAPFLWWVPVISTTLLSFIAPRKLCRTPLLRVLACWEDGVSGGKGEGMEGEGAHCTQVQISKVDESLWLPADALRNCSWSPNILNKVASPFSILNRIPLAHINKLHLSKRSSTSLIRHLSRPIRSNSQMQPTKAVWISFWRLWRASLESLPSDIQTKYQYVALLKADSRTNECSKLELYTLSKLTDWHESQI